MEAFACHYPSRLSRTLNQGNDWSQVGWGGRIRTCEWRHQKALPYHLATPQQARYANRHMMACSRASIGELFAGGNKLMNGKDCFS
jgi:hypothetical protein